MKGKNMKIRILIISALTLLSSLYASVTVSPNLYTYVHTYDYYQDYNIQNATSIRFFYTSPGFVDKEVFTRPNLSWIWLDWDLSPTGTSYRRARIDGNIVANMYGTPGVVPSGTANLSLGEHTLTVESFDTDGRKIGTFTENFCVIQDNIRFTNTFKDELVQILNGSISVKKPILVVEGFDPGNENTVLTTKNLLTPFLTQLNGYDVYILNFKDGGRDLRDNAMTVLGTLQFIRSKYNNTLCEGIKVFGISMGGVISRYALSFAEQNNLPHYTSEFISCDSPQRGAVLNHAFQSRIFDLAENNSISGSTNQFKKMKASLQSIAARQLLTNSYADDSSMDNYYTGGDSFKEYFCELNSEIIDNPSVVVLNTDSNHPKNNPGFPYKQNNIKNLSISNGRLEIDGNINNNPLLCEWDFGGDQLDVPSKPYDRQPGSTLGLLNDNIDWMYTWKLWIQIDFDRPRYDPIFIPTKSSLYLKTPNNVVSDLANYNQILIPSGQNTLNYLSDNSPFDECVVQPTNKYIHAYVSETTVNTVLNWLNNGKYNNTGLISGTLSGENLSGVSIKAYANNILYGSYLTSSSGQYEIPYPYICSSTIRLEFVKQNCYPTSITFSVNYNTNGTISYALPSVSLTSFVNTSIKIDKNISIPAYRSINEAIQFVRNDCISTLRKTYNLVINGQSSSPWNEQVNLSSLNNVNLTLTGASNINSNYVIDTDGIGILIDNNINSLIKIKNLKIANNDLGIVNLDTNNGCTFVVESCNFYNNINDSYMQYPGSGIHSKLPMNITDCQFDSNASVWGNSILGNTPESGFGAALYMVANNGTIDFLRNKIINNRGKGYAVYIKSTDSQFLTIVNCKDNVFRENFVLPGQGQGNQYSDFSTALLVGYMNSITFEKNIITKEKNYDYSYYTAYFNSNKNVKIFNNTFSENYLTSFKLTGSTANVIKISNNIISKNISSNAFNYIYNLDNVSTSTVVTNYNLCFENKYLTNTNVSVIPTGFENSDPEIYAENVGTGYTPFAPIWNTSKISKSIDKGNPDLNGNNISWINDGLDRDGDGSRKDIGAIAALEYHKQNIKMYQGTGSTNFINWISVPSMNTLTTGKDYFPYVFEEFTSSNFTKLYFNGLNGNQLNIYTLGNAIYNSNNQLFRYLGYQLTLPSNVEVDITGFDLPETYEFNLVVDPNIGQLLKAQYNWCGYFLEQPMTPWSAFASVLDKIDEIKTKNWTTMKVNGVWTNYNTPGYTLSYGDMVMVHCTQSTTARLGSNNTQQASAPRQAAQTFNYTEEEDYVPLFIDLNDNSKNISGEIGLFINGVCQGAAVIDNNIVQLNAYVLNDTIDYSTADISFEIHYAGKSDPKIIKNYSLFVQSQKKYLSQKLNMGSNERFYKVKLNDNPEIIYETALENNYPNPFNPSTTIRFSLKEDTNIELSVFNVKGQKVKTLKKGNLTKGVHAVIWNGKDTNNNTCASGVYFYRLNVGNKTFNKKMLMIK
jgi:hypothetical protein